MGRGTRRTFGRSALAAGLISIAALPAGALAAPRFSPYIDVTLKDPVGLAAAVQGSGAKVINLGFVVTGGRKCTAAWGGDKGVRTKPLAGEIAAARAAGADVRVSFGGAGGIDLARSCRTAAALAREYIATADSVRAKRLDFDIEGKALDNVAAGKRMIDAIGILERSRRVQVTLTIPVSPTGVWDAQLALMKRARLKHVRIDVVNVMAMDYGDEQAPPAEDTMAGYAIKAANAVVPQLNGAYPRSGGWLHRLGVTPMIGVNDVTSEVFTLDDANTLVAYAKSKRLAQLSFWSIDRDAACPGPITEAQATCSGVAQTPFAFSAIFRTFT
jgi:hypothetical protein